FVPPGDWPEAADGIDALRDPKSAARFLRASGVTMPARQPEAGQLRRLREIRSAAEALARGRTAEYEEHARGLLRRYTFTLGPRGEVEHEERGWDAFIVGALLELVELPSRGAFRLCKNPACRWAFLDRSHSGRRVWCDMALCGNRAKVARFRRRQRRTASARR
ncbi:MAG: CGNR zinc finger domain-containing protein, partial [Candidatus Rokuibacteriota bacterium]